MKRVVSMIASSTEIVSALGRGSWLVGRSHECDFPASVLALPICTEAKLNPLKDSLAIDADVKDMLRQAVSVYRVDPEMLRKLSPEVILTQSQCKVCAVSEADVEAALASWLGARPQVLSLSPDGLEDVFGDIERVGAALKAGAEAKALVDSLRARVEAVRARAVGAARPGVACIEWIEPLMAAGNWVPELVEFAGGRNLFGTARKHSPWMKWEELRAADPEVIVLMPCGFDLERTRKEAAVLRALEGWSKLRAVRDGKVFAVDGNQYFNRPGPRLLDSLEILGEILHPELFPARYRGAGWAAL